MEDGERNGSRQAGGRREPSTLKAVGLVIASYLGFVVLIVAVSAFVYRLFEPGRSRALEAALAEAAARDLEVDTHAYAARFHTLDSTENAAYLYEQVFPTVHDNARAQQDVAMKLPLVGRERFPSFEERLPENMIQAARDYIAPCEGVFAVLREASEIPGCQYSIEWDGIATLLPHLTVARATVRTLTLAAWLDALDGKADEAVAKIGDAVAIVRSFSGDPFTVSILVQHFCAGIAARDGLLQVLARCRPSSDALSALQARLEEAAETMTVRNAFEDEVVTCAYFRDCADEGDYEMLYAICRDTVASTSSRELTRTEKWTVRRKCGAYLAARTRVALAFLDATREVTPEVLRMPLPANLKWNEPGAPFPPLEEHVSQLHSMLRRSEQTRVILRSGAAALAALRFRMEKGEWPESLEALVPEFMAKVPVDPFSGAPVVYRIVEAGVMVYSVGPNGVDDGGRPLLVETKEEGNWDDGAGVRIRLDANSERIPYEDATSRRESLGDTGE